MTVKINVNGEINDEAAISVLDHGFLFGHSVYEVVCTYKNHPCFLQKHLNRLRKSADAVEIDLPYSDERFVTEISNTVDAAANEESYIRIIVTRGIGEIDIDPVSCGSPNVLIYVTEAKEYPPQDYKKGINVALVSIKRNPKEALNPGIKTGNYLNNVLAKMEANRVGAKDALMLNNEGYLTECTTSNFFFVKEGCVKTPSEESGILPGITRDCVIRLARENGILVEEGEWPPESLDSAEEAFLTGTLKKIMPVTFLNGHPVGSGQPGPVTQRLIHLYQEMWEKQR